LTLNTAGATNFENLLGSSKNEILEGDSSANWIAGDGGLDTLYGNAGNDRLAADSYAILNYPTDDERAIVEELSRSNLGVVATDDGLYGGSGDDSLYGNQGDNTLDGGTGSDKIFSGSGSDIIVIRAGDGSVTLTQADRLKDFSDGTDLISLDGINFSDLVISQGVADFVSHTLVSLSSSNEFLLIIENANSEELTEADFVQ